MPPTIVISQTSSTWTLTPITHPNGGTISGYFSLGAGGTWFWSCSASEPGGKLAYSASGTVNAAGGQAQADANLRQAAQGAYDLMTVVP